jgi:Ca-activated chloride channel family protein
MLGRKVHGRSRASKLDDNYSSVPNQSFRRGEAAIMKSLSMKLRIAFLLVALFVLTGPLTSAGMWTASAQTTPQAAKPAAPPTAQTQSPATPPAAGQTPPPPDNSESNSDDSVTTIKSRVNEVRVVFTVTDRHGRYIKDLKQNDFKVIDDQKPAELRSFHSETNLPLQVGLLVDASNSIRDRFKFEQEAAIEFLNAIIRPHYDKAFVVGFDSTPEVTQDFTDNTENLSAGVRMLRAGGGTAMYDALYFACRDKLLKQEQTGPVRRAIILLSDGDDNSSHVSR